MDLRDSQITKICGREDQGFVDISAMALNAAIKGSILAESRGLLREHDGGMSASGKGGLLHVIAECRLRANSGSELQSAQSDLSDPEI